MKAIALSVAFEIASTVAFAQGAADPMENVRSCSPLERAERLECLGRMSRNITPPAPSASNGDNWVVSETTSPVNYTPIISATVFSRGGSDDPMMQFAIHCRGGRTELLVSAPALVNGGADYTISYRVNDGQPVQLAAGQPSFGKGASFTGDVVRLLQSFPEEGQLAVRVSTRSGAAHDGQFSLGGLKAVREKLATACKWPTPLQRPETSSRPSVIGNKR